MHGTLSIALTPVNIGKLGPLDSAALQAHCLRLDAHEALSLFSARREPVAVRRYVSGIDFERDIVLAGFDAQGVVRATVRIRVDTGGRCAEMLLARERDRIEARHWNELISSAVEVARNASLSWLSVASLGYDADTRDALEDVGFRLQADEGGTIGELCLRAAQQAASLTA